MSAAVDRHYSIKVLKLYAKQLGCTVRLEDGEYRVNIRGNSEDSAYYTDDSVDALETMRLMSAARACGAMQ